MEKIEKVLEILKEQGLDGIYITKEANVKCTDLPAGELSHYGQPLYRAGRAVLPGL